MQILYCHLSWEPRALSSPSFSRGMPILLDPNGISKQRFDGLRYRFSAFRGTIFWAKKNLSQDWCYCFETRARSSISSKLCRPQLLRVWMGGGESLSTCQKCCLTQLFRWIFKHSKQVQAFACFLESFAWFLIFKRNLKRDYYRSRLKVLPCCVLVRVFHFHFLHHCIFLLKKLLGYFLPWDLKF